MTENLQIPAMQIKASNGETVELPQLFEGKWTVLYFYPKDDTPGCTRQACSYRDNLNQFGGKNAQIIGVSADSLDSHRAFIEKFDLNFLLLCDESRQLSEALQTIKSEGGISRDTFLIDPKGKINQVWRKVDPVESVAESLAAIPA